MLQNKQNETCPAPIPYQMTQLEVLRMVERKPTCWYLKGNTVIPLETATFQ